MPGAMHRKPGLPWYHGWNIVAVCVLAQVAALSIIVTSYSLFLHGWSDEFHVPISSLAIAITIFSAGAVITAPLVGMASDHISARKIYAVGLGGIALFHLAISFVTASWQIMALYTVLLPWVMSCCTTVHGQAVVSRWFVRRAGLALGLGVLGSALSGLVGPPLVLWLMPAIGWRGVWLVGAALVGFVVLPLVLFTVRDRPTEEEGAYYIGGGRAEAHGPPIRYRAILSRRNFWLMVGIFLPSQWCFMSLTVNAAPIVADRHLSPVDAGIAIGLLSIFALLGKVGAGLVVDRAGNRIPAIIAPMLGALGMLTLAFERTGFMPIVAAVVLVGLSAAVWTLLASITAMEFGANGFGRAFGLASGIVPFGSFAAPLFARGFELSGSYTDGCLVLAALCLLGSVCGWVLRENREDPNMTQAAEVTITDAPAVA